jgi:signal peptidase I
VEVRNDQLLINGKPVDEPYLAKNREEAAKLGVPLTNDFGPVRVGEGEIFVLGDNRLNSHDSRAIGPISLDRVVGRAEFVFWPLSQIRLAR